MSDDDDLLTASTMYYLQDLKMDAIAAHLHISRSSVSRLLKRAREEGLVEITLRPTPSLSSELAREIAATYGIECQIVPVPDGVTGEERLDQVARTTAHLLAGWFDSDMVLGVAWGTTLSAIARHLVRKPTRGSAVVQLNGAANNRTFGVDYVSDLVSGFARAFDAAVHLFPVPAFFDYADTRRAMWRERSVARVLDVQRRADMVLFSIGAIAGDLPSHVYAAGYLDPDDITALGDEGVVGDVCTVFLRADGTYRDLALNERATGPTPDELRRIPRRVCAVAGDAKVVPLRAALLAGVVTHLITDELTAKALRELGRDPLAPRATSIPH
ncbi:Deoxyribonucleoside regulator [Microbacterium sp. TNHR37B]|nr:Deoxyribonucleoside regulator [Microbacterium sp. TNHR37B]